MGTNRTGLKSFDRLAKDPRVEEIWSEGKDGYWVSLAPGFHFEDCISVHGWTVAEVLANMKIVEPMDAAK